MPRSPQHLALGQAVRQLRQERGFSQEGLAHASGLHRNHIGGIERGELNPSFTSILRVAESLEVRVSDLVRLSESLFDDSGSGR